MPSVRKISKIDTEFYDFQEDFLESMDDFGRSEITEIQAFGSTWTISNERKFETINEVQVYVDALISSTSFQSAFPNLKKRILVKASKKTDKVIEADAWSHSRTLIEIPEHSGTWRSWAMRELIVLHEVAHCVTPKRDGHGENFRKTYFDLLSFVYGGSFSGYARTSLWDSLTG